MELRNKHITVAGLGTTGQALAQFLHRRGAHVTVTDSAPEADLGEAPAKLRELGVRLELGGHGKGVFESADMIVLSPGVPHTIEPVARARKSGVRVIGEIELAGRFISAPVVAVTGTNGKSTVTRLIGQMLDASGLTVFVGGNLGTPLISHADENRPADVVVAEISSFQLDTVETFRPKVAVLLNITADHLDRYPSLYAYGAAKARVFENHTGTDTAVINAADALIMKLARDIRSQKCLFNADVDEGCSAKLDEYGINASPAGSGPVRITYDDIPMVGRHNYENVAAAVLAAMAAGAEPDGVGAGIRGFRPDPHRLEWVAQIRSVNYYDDSKGTNVDAVCRAIEAVRPPVVLILGGRDKGGGYGGLADSIRRHVKAMVLLGEAADAIERELGGMVQTCRADSMAEAVGLAEGLADAGDTVLLSPACSSFDMYESYAGRGRDFQQAVHSLENRKNG
ncbi:MAG: UDP-N-acetylmuramoyl-L-alanine--D-glutamate ligase [Desulfobacteraceae bacterium]|nr:UDP-N-acetylmuramoyl-L-alanine--D-glutamate ligase [Desulfobacteraceae bacterium]